jgi:hypothetical protein
MNDDEYGGQIEMVSLLGRCPPGRGCQLWMKINKRLDLVFDCFMSH